MGQIAQQLLALNSAKHAIRQAINDKGGGPLSKGDPLSAYPDAIAAIPTGGGVKAVVFFDYDGTIVTSYSVEDFLELEEMPENPEHDGLTAQGWNWSLADAQAYVQKYGVLYVGQMYKPTDGKLHLVIILSKDLTFRFNITGLVDWGDGSATQSASGQVSHAYAAAGKYEVTVEVVTSIDDSAFYNCYALHSVVIPEGVISIAGSAFSNCFALHSIVIPEGVTSIGSNAFYFCRSLQSVVLPDTIVTIDASVFHYCNALRSVMIPKSRIYLSGGVFSGCYALQFTVIPEGANIQSTTLFSYCSALQSVVIPEDVIMITNGMFQYCYSLQSIVIPEGVISIGRYAFYNCFSLQIVCKAVTPPTLGDSAFEKRSPVRIFVPDAAVADYKAATNWSEYADMIFPISALTE